MATSVTAPPPGAPGSAAASKIFLVVAILLGVLATLLAFMFISSAGAGNTGPQIQVTVAKRDLAPNTVIDPSRDLKVMRIPQQFSVMAAHRLDPANLNLYQGQRLNREILADQPVLQSDIAPFSAVDLVLEKPYEALTLPADTGIIIPGDYVKILLTRSNLVGAVATMPMPGLPQYDAIVVGKDDGFKVLAVGGRTFLKRSQVTAPEYSSSASVNKTVTLRVTEAQAKEIMGAVGSVSSSNRVTLLLCPSPMTAAPAPQETSGTEPPATGTSNPAPRDRL